MNDDVVHVIVEHESMLSYIRDIAAFAIFREQVIKRLIPVRTHILRNGLIPFLAIGEDRINIEHHATKSEHAVLHNVADTEAGMRDHGCLDGSIEIGRASCRARVWKEG